MCVCVCVCVCTSACVCMCHVHVDLEEFRGDIRGKLTNFCWQAKFEECHQQAVSLLVFISEKYGRLRTTLSEVYKQRGRTQTLDRQSELLHSSAIIIQSKNMLIVATSNKYWLCLVFNSIIDWPFSYHSCDCLFTSLDTVVTNSIDALLDKMEAPRLEQIPTRWVKLNIDLTLQGWQEQFEVVQPLGGHAPRDWKKKKYIYIYINVSALIKSTLILFA